MKKLKFILILLLFLLLYVILGTREKSCRMCEIRDTAEVNSTGLFMLNEGQYTQLLGEDTQEETGHHIITSAGNVPDGSHCTIFINLDKDYSQITVSTGKKSEPNYKQMKKQYCNKCINSLYEMNNKVDILIYHESSKQFYPIHPQLIELDEYSIHITKEKTTYNILLKFIKN